MGGEEEEGEEKIEQERLPIDERIEQLRAEEKNDREITRILYDERYATTEIMKRKLSLAHLRKKKPTSSASVHDAIAGTTKGPGYLDEFKTMIQQQISRSRELTDVFYNIGLGTLLASLSKSGLSMEDFRKIALKKEGLREALESAGKTVFKALEYFESDLIVKVEKERDEARAYSTILESRVNKMLKSLDPKFRLEKMIQTYLFSGNVDPDTMDRLLDKWLAMEVTEVKLELIAS